MTSTPHPPSTSGGLTARAGLDPTFLGVTVQLPRPRDAAIETVLLRYTHFEVLMRPDRRLAAVAGVGIDGASLREVSREGLQWWLDPRLPEEQQAGPQVYADNDLDRGHLVRRRSPVWGEDAELANADTFYYTNCAPQAAAFNQGEELWLGLEDYLLDNAATYDRRLVVFTGPVLDPSDPVYRGVGIPLRFFKVAAFLDQGQLAATGYVLDQTPQLGDVPGVDLETLTARASEGEAPPLGPFRGYQVPVADVAQLSGLDLDALIAVDRPPLTADVPAAAAASDAPTARPGPASGRWRRLRSVEDIDLGG